MVDKAVRPAHGAPPLSRLRGAFEFRDIQLLHLKHDLHHLRVLNKVGQAPARSAR
jgi:hypothetical protein